MSSILDALNKVEEDRNAHASDSDADAPFAPEKAAQALITPPKKRRRSARHSSLFDWTPVVYAVGGLIGIALIVGLSAVVGLLVGGANHAVPAVAAMAKSADEAPVQAVGRETYTVPAPVPKESPALPDANASKPVETTAEQPHETRPIPVEPAPKAVLSEPPPMPAPPVEARTPEPEPVKVVAERPEPPVPEPVKPVVKKPIPKPVAEPMRIAKAAPVSAEEPTNPLPTPEAIARERAAATETRTPATTPMHSSPISLAPGRVAEKRAPLLEDVNTLPRLGQTERERLGLGEMRLNVLREASASQPEGLAIINLKKVYVGEMIPGTNARLIAVQTRAIGIEIEGTGERFKVLN